MCKLFGYTDECMVMLGDQRRVVLDIQMDVWLCWVIKGVSFWIYR